jgi:hypothetical protein
MVAHRCQRYVAARMLRAALHKGCGGCRSLMPGLAPCPVAGDDQHPVDAGLGRSVVWRRDGAGLRRRGGGWAPVEVPGVSSVHGESPSFGALHRALSVCAVIPRFVTFETGAAGLARRGSVFRLMAWVSVRAEVRRLPSLNLSSCVGRWAWSEQRPSRASQPDAGHGFDSEPKASWPCRPGSAIDVELAGALGHRRAPEWEYPREHAVAEVQAGDLGVDPSGPRTIRPVATS